MFKIFITSLASVLILGASACNYDASQTNTALIVDLPAVARALGRDEVMTQKLEQARQQLSEQLVQIGADLEKQLKDKETDFGKSSDENKEESRKQLDQLVQQANIQLKKIRELANQKAISYRDKLVSEFRNEVMQVAEDIAQQHQAVAVYVAGSNLLWYSSTIDITDEVIGVMRAQEKTVTDKTQAQNQESSAAEQDAGMMDVTE
jgi:Skp family chaperone for outer membrane proteins